MINYWPIIFAVFPFLVFLFLLFTQKMTLLKVSVITLALYTILAIFYWKIIGTFLYASFGKGIFTAIDIFIIIFGAIFFWRFSKI